MSEDLSRTADAGRFAPAAIQERAAPDHGCEERVTMSLRSRLLSAGLRPTRQRVALGGLLFRKGDRHVTAERLFEEATAAKMQVSLATVYNTLHQFTAVGLLREIAIDGERVYFDTNTSEHHHFLIEDGEGLFDIPGSQIDVSTLPAPPSGLKISRIDVVVRLRKDEA
jgi:Fur family transcriptional regulator, iron response regulator